MGSAHTLANMRRPDGGPVRCPSAGGDREHGRHRRVVTGISSSACHRRTFVIFSLPLESNVVRASARALLNKSDGVGWTLPSRTALRNSRKVLTTVLPTHSSTLNRRGGKLDRGENLPQLRFKRQLSHDDTLRLAPCVSHPKRMSASGSATLSPATWNSPRPWALRYKSATPSLLPRSKSGGLCRKQPDDLKRPTARPKSSQAAHGR